MIAFYILQRISEMIFSRKNEIELKKYHQAIEVSPRETLKMKLFHTIWFISLIIESHYRAGKQTGAMAGMIYFILGTCLLVRLHTMRKLGKFWTIKILSMKSQEISTTGLYRYIRHPNYLIVLLEFIFLPLLFKSYYTLFIFSFLNAIVITQRMKLEEDTLMSQTNYKKLFAAKKRLVPYLIMFLAAANLNAAEIKLHTRDYKEAKGAQSFVKFESTSTKFSMLTTTFDGYAKDIVVRYDVSDNQITNIDVTIPAKSLDTDSIGRNEKMQASILESDKFPNISVISTDKVRLVEGEQTISMTFAIKDKKITKPVKLLISKNHEKFLINGSTTLGLKEANIPDPSIIIAKVRDSFDLSFAISL
jgi:methyltransferase